MKRQFWIVAVVAALTALAAILILSLRQRDPLFRGKPESVWISEITYSDDTQGKVWQEFGSDGVRMLVRGLRKADHPFARAYRKIYRGAWDWLPSTAMRLLPSPRDDATRSVRMSIVQLLSQLRHDTKISTPAVVRALRDEDASVRQLAITFFTASEDQNAPLGRMEEIEKKRFLPVFTAAMGDDNWGLRNNAAIALGYYREQREIVVPILLKALGDPHKEIRLVAAKSLNRVAPDTVVGAGVIPLLVENLKDTDDQVAHRAAELLGEIAQQPELAVPALVESVRRTNSLVASTAVRALGRFGEQARPAMPLLLDAMTDKRRSVRREATNALSRIESTGVRKK